MSSSRYLLQRKYPAELKDLGDILIKAGVQLWFIFSCEYGSMVLSCYPCEYGLYLCDDKQFYPHSVI